MSRAPRSGSKIKYNDDTDDSDFERKISKVKKSKSEIPPQESKSKISLVSKTPDSIKESPNIQIICDSCGQDCWLESYFIKKSQNDFCPKCFNEKQSSDPTLKGELQKKGITIGNTSSNVSIPKKSLSFADTDENLNEKNKGRNIDAVDKLNKEVKHENDDDAAAKEEEVEDESSYSNESDSSSSNESFADSDSSSNVKSKNRKNDNLSKVPAKNNLKPSSVSNSKNVTTNKPIASSSYNRPTTNTTNTSSSINKLQNRPSTSSSIPPQAIKTTSAVTSSSSSHTSHTLTKGIEPEGPGASDDITRGPPVNSESQAKKLIVQYMKQQNRPYSAIQVFDNLHKRIPKSTVEKVLSVLSEQSNSSDGSEGPVLRCKDYGKAKIYFYNQMQLPTLSDNEIGKIDAEIALLNKECKSLEELARETSLLSSKLLSQPTDADLDQVLQETKVRVELKRKKMSELMGPNSKPIDPLSRNKIIEEFNFYRNTWKNLKMKCTDILESFAEDGSKKIKDLMDMMGIESDEAEKVILPPPIPLPKSK